ncbi:MAG: DNA cytosine methyltransferase [Armatimonadetes bacterium]|nr:DNA cytosine methyltransferase [Armatimonadota bacterium]NOG39064.1 DNA cytosine methyltransferase [Armatimonadota bacterium]
MGGSRAPRVASFFAGIGGFDLGFESAGFEVVFQCERDAFCQEVLRKHWPQVPLHADIRTLESIAIPEAEVWTAGFPCQDLSLANQGKRRGLYGERSGLFYTFAELAERTRPQWLVLENVVGLLNSNDGEDFRTLVATLDELGYCVAWRVLDAKHFGSPQRRRRTFVVASYQTDCALGVLFGPGAIEQVAAEARLPGAHAPSRSPIGHRDADIYAIQHASIGRKPTAGPQAKGYRSDGESYTLDSRGSSDTVCSTDAGFRVRSTSGLSRDLDGRRFRALGNAVNVNVARWLAKRIRAASNTAMEAPRSSCQFESLSTSGKELTLSILLSDLPDCLQA